MHNDDTFFPRPIASRFRRLANRPRRERTRPSSSMRISTRRRSARPTCSRIWSPRFGGRRSCTWGRGGERKTSSSGRLGVQSETAMDPILAMVRTSGN